jgi:surface protein
MKKSLILVAFIFLCSYSVFSQMVLVYQITNNPTTISLPLNGTVNVTVNWGDGITETVTSSGNKTHTYTNVGSKTLITITGTLTWYGVNVGPNQTGITLLRSVRSWNNLGLTSLSHAFQGATQLDSVPTSLPSGVTDLSFMFDGASSFNQSIDAWNTSAITDMTSMFANASSFNQAIYNWNTAAVTTMFSMFAGASSFNQPIGNWNTAAVTDLSYMFEYANSFNQSLGTWNISNVSSMDAMFEGVTLCTYNYDNLLNGWAARPIKSGVTFDGGNSQYSSASSTAKNNLYMHGWLITDGSLGTNNTNCPTAGLKQNLISQVVEIYPNPSTGLITISSSVELGNIIIYNSVGNIVYQINTSSIQKGIDISANEPGIYLIKIGYQSSKLIKE